MAEKTTAPRTRTRRAAAVRSPAPSAAVVRPARKATKRAAPARRAVTLGVPVPTVTVRRVEVSGRWLYPGRWMYYVGLGALAALDVVSWPVAAAIGGGVWVASRSRAAVRS